MEYRLELAEVVRKYPRGGGQPPKGMTILKQGKDWTADSADPDKVSELLLAAQFDGMKAVASCFKAAALVTSHYGWNLTWRDDFALGAYLISCLIKAKFYSAWLDYDHSARPEYRLSVRDRRILEFPEADTTTSHTPFPIWFSAKDEQGHILVKPSHPQLKETVWEPDATHLRNAYGVDEAWNPSTQKWNPRKSPHEEFSTIQSMQWLRAVHALESNAYQINERLLKVAESIENDPKRRLPEGLPNYASDKEALDQRFLQEEIDNLEVLKKNKLLSDKEDQVRKAYWIDHYDLVQGQQSAQTKRSTFVRTLKRANQLKGKPFYHRVFCDYRGRIYLNDSILNYQGGDLQRALVEFSVGKPIREGDWKFLWLQIANSWGLKGNLNERIEEAKKMQGDIVRFASDPVDTYDEWSEAGDKWQFLRTCFEVSDVLSHPDRLSHLICEIDQSTSCLQHMALVMDDVEMLRKVNIGPDYSDIYQTIGDDLKLEGVVSPQHRRKIVKTALVPWSYGGGIKRIVESYDELELPCLQKLTPTNRFHLARQVVSKIEDHLPMAVEYQNRMREIAEELIKDGANHFHWKTPSGFEVHHFKQEQNEYRVRIFLSEKTGARLSALEPQGESDKKRLSRGLPPNFIHSVDASVVHSLLSTIQGRFPLVTVHDAFGAHASSLHEVTELFYLQLAGLYRGFNPVMYFDESMKGTEIPILQTAEGISEEAYDLIIQSTHALT